jgi:hypothetical protein
MPEVYPEVGHRNIIWIQYRLPVCTKKNISTLLLGRAGLGLVATTVCLSLLPIFF